MAYTKQPYVRKIWVDVPDPTNPPPIPDGQDALARLDELNMNRIEDGIEEAQDHINDSSLHNKSTDGGGAVGSDASATAGGAVGKAATTTLGGALGFDASSEEGAAIGFVAKTGSGVAAGYEAKTVDEYGNGIDAIQLGTGTNNTPKTLQVYGHQLMKADGTIPDERMPSKAPAGHGLGEIAPILNYGINKSYVELLQKGAGFYQVKNGKDSPTSTTADQIDFIQSARDISVGKESGIQMAFDGQENGLQGWIRNVRGGTASSWFEMIHSGNYERYGSAKIFHGFYNGADGGKSYEKQKVLTFNFRPKLLVIENHGNPLNVIKYRAILIHGIGETVSEQLKASEYNNNARMFAEWVDNPDGTYSVGFYSNRDTSYGLNATGENYNYVAIG